MYWDLLTKIKNAEAVGKSSLRVPFSKVDLSVAEKLGKNGYIRDAKKKLVGKKKFIDIELIPEDKRDETISFRIISKPSRHVYKKSKDFRAVKNGYGMGVVSTSQGILTAGEAKKRRVGGEYLFDIW